ncbi:MAG: potassium-transporting ATPase subunit C [Candidatus Dormibacteria bacterium]
MITQLRSAVVLALGALLLFGLAYPLAGTGVSQLLFPQQANGSLTKNGSTLVGQPWNGPQWFHGRPDPDNPLRLDGVPGASGGSNLGPRSRQLVAEVRAEAAQLRRMGAQPTADLVTSSGSGIDPDITPQDALAQVPMVSRSTGIPESRLRRLIRTLTVGPELGFLGPSYVDVLELNWALARLR